MLLRTSTPRHSQQASGCKARRWLSNILLGSTALASIAGLSGCSREHYRTQADEEVQNILQEKDCDPRWEVPKFSIYGDPRARYYSPFDPDAPPMPADDPSSHELMKCVYGMKGYENWLENGCTTQIENPSWQYHLDEIVSRNDNGKYVLGLEQAVSVALLNSSDYKNNLEELYLSALDVSTERFRFDVQFFLGNSQSYTHRGSELTGGASTSTLTSTTAASGFGGNSVARKLLPTGGQLLINFANSFVWQFAGDDSNTTASSLVGFNLIQPLLRNAGRMVALNTLTLSERALLSNIRQMERYRRGFLPNIMIGTNIGGGPRRRGGFAGGTGLSGFTGLGVGGFSGVGAATGFGGTGQFRGGGGGAGGAGGAGFAGGAAGNVGGFYGLLQQAQQIRNRRANLNSQIENLARVEALFDAGRIDSQQVDQFRQNVQTARSQYLSALNGYQSTLDNFLTGTLGLPPNLEVELDQSDIAELEFADPNLTELQEGADQVLSEIRNMSNLGKEITPQEAGVWVQKLVQFGDGAGEHLELVRSDLEKLNSVKDTRLKRLSTEKDRAEFMEQLKNLSESFDKIQTRLAQSRKAISDIPNAARNGSATEARDLILDRGEALTGLLLEMQLVHAGIRLEAIVIEPVDLTSERALELALANRLDLMNLRASIVDQWRLLAINANRLEANVQVELGGQLGTVNRNPVKFRDQAGQMTATLRIDAPLTRVQERNDYMQSLIDYQRVRRDYIESIDSLNQGLRSNIRTIEQFEEEMELQRVAMRIAIRRVDQTQEALREPPRVDAAGQGVSLGENAVRNLLAALDDFLSTQNQVMATYLSYQSARLQLYRDLEIIRFDENGVWIDEPLDVALADAASAVPLYPENCDANTCFDSIGLPMIQSGTETGPWIERAETGISTPSTTTNAHFDPLVIPKPTSILEDKEPEVDLLPIEPLEKPVEQSRPSRTILESAKHRLRASAELIRTALAGDDSRR